MNLTTRILRSTIGIMLLCVSSAFAQSIAIPNFKYSADIAAHTGTRFNPDTGCGTQPFAQDARIWSVVLRPDFDQIPNLTKIDPSLALYSDTANNLYTVIFDGPNESELSITNKGNRQKVVVHNVAGLVWMEVAELTLAQVGDTADSIRTNSGLIGGGLSGKGYTAMLYKITDVTPDGSSRLPLVAYGDLLSGIDPVSPEGKTQVQDRLLRSTKETIELNIKPPAGSPEGTKDTVVRVSSTLLDSRLAGIVQLDDKSINQLTKDVAQLATRGTGSPGEDSVNPPIFVIDEPCVSVSVSPVLSGSSPSLATVFRLRYDFYSPDGRSFLKLRADGDGDLGGGYFNRGEGTMSFGINNKGAVNFAGGATGGYSFTRVAGKVVDEWTAAGKFEAHLPALFFAARPGSLVRPILNVEGGASGGNRVTPGAVGTPVLATHLQTAFLAKANFLYTMRPSSRLSLDFQATAGASDKKMYANQNHFSSVQMQARFNVTKDYDFMVHYDCGKRDPEYRKFCGWQTGIVLVTGR